MKVKTKRTTSKRFMAMLLSVLMLLSLVPTSVLAATGTNDVVTAVAALDKTAYTVENGTAQADIGLPAELTVSVTTPAAEEGGEAVPHEENLSVTWEGSYDASAAGDYTLTAKFADRVALAEGVEMPAVTVTVGEAISLKSEPMEEAAAEEVPVEKPSAPLAAPKADVKIVSLTSPLLTIDRSGGEKTSTTSNRSKGYQAQFSARASDQAAGVPTVWLGYRFTLKVPDGCNKDAVVFDANTHVWLRDMADAGKVAVAVYDEPTRTWTLEGKYQYNDPAKPLGSGAALTYSTGIAIRTGWVRENAAITPAMQTWLIDDPAVDTGVGTGETTTVENTPTLQSELKNPMTEIVPGYYDASTGKFYYTAAEATAAGAANAKPGRVFSIAGYATTAPEAANELLQQDQEVSLEIPLKVTTAAGDETDPALQPYLLVAHYDSVANANTNIYTAGLKDDPTFGGRSPGTTDSNHWVDANMPGIMKDVSYQNGTIKAIIAPSREQSSVYYYMAVFVPVDPTDTTATNRILTAGDKVYTTEKTPGGKDYTGVDWGVKRAALVKPIEPESEVFKGAYTRWIDFNNASTAFPLGAKNQWGWITVSNLKSDPRVEIKAFDALIKVDADYMKVDTSKSTLTVTNNNVGLTSYPVKYGVLPGGGNWASDDEMSSTRKDALTYYPAGSVPAGSKVVALLVEARGGTKGGMGSTSLQFSFDVTEDGALVQTVGQMTLDLDIWSTGHDPATEPPTVQLPCDYDGPYVKDYYDASGTRYEHSSKHVYGDSFLVTGYYTSTASENLNGANRPAGEAGAYTSGYDITFGERTMDIKDSITFAYQGNPDDEPKDLEFQFRMEYPVADAPGLAIQPDSIQLNASYTPGATPGAAGIIQGGTLPDKVEFSQDGRTLYAYFTVKGGGTYDVYASLTLGDALNPDKDLSMGTKTFTPAVVPIGQTQMLAPNRGQFGHHPSISKSTVAGFYKTAHSKVTVLNGEIGYRLSLSAQNRNLTGAMTLDVLPFNGDGRGTVMAGSYTIDKPVTLTMTTQNDPVLTDGKLYYTTDTAIRKNPLSTVDDVKGLNFTDGGTQLGVVWHEAQRTTSGKVFSYVVDPDTTAIVMAGTIGSLEAPAIDIYLQTKDMAAGDTLANTAGFTADGIGDSMNSSSVSSTISNRSIKGTAWLDVNNNGAQDAGENGIAGLTVKLYQDTTEITLDAAGKAYNVTTGADGKYVFDNMPSSASKYHVVFSDGTIGEFAVSEKSKAGVDEDKNSDVTADPATGTMTSAVSDEVNLLTLEQQNATNTPIDTKQIDGGFVPFYTITFDTNGGTPDAINSQRVISTGLATEPTAPTKTDKIFGGWYYTKGGVETKWDFNTPVTEDLDLVAKWSNPTGAKVNVTGTKTLTGGGKTDADILADQFSFTVTADTANPVDGVIGLPAGDVMVAAGGALDFGTWEFLKTGTYVFTVAENTPGAGYTKGADVTVTVEVTFNNANGTLEAAVTYTSGATLTIENTYTAPTAVGVTLNGTKTLTENGADKTMSDGQFTVAIAQDAGNDTTGYTGFKAGNKDIAADGTFSFDEITFAKAGTYKFIITENDLGAAGYTYDNKAVTATVVVTLDETDNTLHTAVTYEKDGAAAAGMTFANTYGTPASASLTLAGTKTLTENGNNKAMTAGQFTFAAAEDAGNNKTGYTGFMAGNKNVAADGRFSFDEITFTKAGTYKFIITENDLGVAGYTYDNKAVTATVVVTLDETDNTLHTAVTYEKDGAAANGIIFANTYTTPDTVAETFTGTKTLTENGADKTMSDGQFTVAIAQDAGNDTTGYTGFTAGNKDIAADGTFSFDEITFAKAGTYKFIITENDLGAAGYTYDNKAVTATVVVTLDETDNTLHTAVTYEKDGAAAAGMTFANTYGTPDPADFTISGNKTLTENGTNKVMAAGQFSFTIAADAANDAAGYTGFTAGSVDVAENGAFTFGTLTFTKAGTYQFNITEDNKGVPGYTYDGKTVVLTVKVTLDGASNKLKAEGAYSEEGTDAAALSFVNTYTTPDAAKVAISGNKTLSGHKTTADIAAEEFTFNVAADAGNDASGYTGLNSTVKVQAEGGIDFGTLSFTKAGTYKFTITENNLGKTGYTYDTASYLLTVTVTLNTDTNKLEAKTVLEKNGENAETITFANSYVPTAVKSDPPVEKVVEGKPSTKGDFTFIFKASDKNNPMPEGSKDGVKEMSIQGAGPVEFGNLTFTKAGTYVYTIAEKNNRQTGYTYDGTTYTVTYAVTDNEGNLAVVRTITANGKKHDKAVFTNKYKEPVTPAPVPKPGQPTQKPKSPKTGDNNNLGLWMILIAMSGASAAGIGLYKRKKRRH